MSEIIDTRILDNRKNKTRKMDTKSNKRPRKEPLANKKRLVSKTIIYDESKPNQWLDDPPLEIWDHVIIPMLGLKDLALARPVCTFFEAYWQDKFSNNVLPLRVGNDVATINDVMGVVEILSSRREYTKASPFVVLLGKGNHEVTSSWTHVPGGYAEQTTLGILCSNITFVGQGIGKTLILGGFGMDNVQNITLKQMTVTNTNGDGIIMYGADVELVDVAVFGCSGTGIRVISTSSPSQLVATRCEMSNNGASGLSIVHYNNIPNNVCLKNCISHHNSGYGIYVEGTGVVNIHGDATAIHSNVGHGIFAANSGKVLLHLPSHHNTIYNNTQQDRHTSMGGTITNVEE